MRKYKHHRNMSNKYINQYIIDDTESIRIMMAGYNGRRNIQWSWWSSPEKLISEHEPDVPI